MSTRERDHKDITKEKTRRGKRSNAREHEYTDEDNEVRNHGQIRLQCYVKPWFR